MGVNSIVMVKPDKLETLFLRLLKVERFVLKQPPVKS